MRWLRAIGGLAVLYVICLTITGLAGLAIGGVLTSSAGPAAIVTVAVLVIGVAAVLAIVRERAVQWRSNPYW